MPHNSQIPRKLIAYISIQYSTPTAASINTERRKQILEKLGYTVLLLQYNIAKTNNILLSLFKSRRLLKTIIIRIDGTCLLDKYSIIKLILPKIPIVWELHGFPEEALSISTNWQTRWFVWKHRILRKLYSRCVNGIICISDEIKRYAATQFTLPTSSVIPNFVVSDHLIQKSAPHHLKKTFIVLWGGQAELPWQAIDTISHVASRVYQYDMSISFIIVGSNRWFNIFQSPNITCLPTMSHNRFLKLISIADVCLALYHESNHFPFYFSPMKILDYMSFGKPVIASNFGSVHNLIQHRINGYLTNNDIQSIAQTIVSLKEDKTLRRRIADKARETIIEKYSERNAMKQYKKFIQRF